MVEYGARGAARFAPAEQLMPPSAPGQVAAPEVTLAGEPTVGTDKVFIPVRLDAHGAPMSTWLEYGETTDYMFFSRDGGWIGADEVMPDPATFEVVHWRLKPNTVYHYRIAAAGPGGKVFSDDATFVTPGGSGSPQESPANPRPVAPEDPDACAATVEEEPEVVEPTPVPAPSATPTATPSAPGRPGCPARSRIRPGHSRTPAGRFGAEHTGGARAAGSIAAGEPADLRADPRKADPDRAHRCRWALVSRGTARRSLGPAATAGGRMAMHTRASPRHRTEMPQRRS